MPDRRARRSGGNAALSSASASVATTPPRALDARAAISQPTPGASAHAADAAVNRARPAANQRRLP